MKRIVGLDYLRIMMVFMVFLFHSWMHLGFQLGKLTSFISEGAVYMTMFFMLSGYVLGLKYKHLPMDKLSLKNFYVKRIASIFPLYIICVVLYPPIYGSESMFQNVLIMPFELLGIQSFFPGLTPVSHNGGTWFVSCIMFCYLLCPLMLRIVSFLSRKTLLIWGTLIFVLLLLSPWIVYTFQIQDIYSNPYIRSLEFMLGIILAATFAEDISDRLNSLLRSRMSRLLSYLSIVIVVMLLLKMHVPHMTYMSYSAILIPFFCWQLLGHTTVPRKENVIINHLADISYSFFLLQLFVFKFTVDASQCIGHVDVNIQFALALIICLVLASLSHKFVEKPIMSWVKSSMLK